MRPRTEQPARHRRGHPLGRPGRDGARLHPPPALAVQLQGRQGPLRAGQPGQTNAKRGGLYSLGNVAMPWAMESTRSRRDSSSSSPSWSSTWAWWPGSAWPSSARSHPACCEIPAVAWTIGWPSSARRSWWRVDRIVRRLSPAGDAADQHPGRLLLAVHADRLVRCSASSTQAHIAGVAAFESESFLVAFLLADQLLPALRAVLEDLPLPLLPVHPVLDRQGPRPPGQLARTPEA